MSEISKKRSRKSKLVPCMYMDLTFPKRDELQSASPDLQSEASSEMPESVPAPIPYTMQVEVESGDDGDDWWKELEEQAQKEKDAQNNVTQAEDNVNIKTDSSEKEVKVLVKEDNTDTATTNLKLGNEISNNNNKQSGNISLLKKANTGEDEFKKFIAIEINENNKTVERKKKSQLVKPKDKLKPCLGEIRSPLDTGIVLQQEKIVGESTVIQLTLAGKGSEASISKVECGSSPSTSNALKRSAGISKFRNKPAKKVKHLKNVIQEVEYTPITIRSLHYYANAVNEMLKKMEKDKTIISELKILSYQCHPCKFCWEHYCDFKSHLDIRHKDITVSIGIEYSAHTFYNVIATDLPTRRPTQAIDFEDGFKILSSDLCSEPIEIFKCLRCKTSFKNLMELQNHRKVDQICICNKIGKCYEIQQHQGVCHEYIEHNFIKSCECGWKSNFAVPHKGNCGFRITTVIHKCMICTQKFPTLESLLEHQTVFHTVRSDEFFIQSPIFCDICLGVYFRPRLTHYCPKLSDLLSCNACAMQFQNRVFLRLHLKAYLVNVACKTCGMILARSCQQAAHDALNHDSGFQIIPKCNICGQLFANDLSLKMHAFHAHVGDKRKIMYPSSQVLLPKDKIEIKGHLCQIIYSASGEPKDTCEDLNETQSVILNPLELHHNKQINQCLQILATAIKHRVLLETKIRYECKPCQTSWVDITDFKTHINTLCYHAEKPYMFITAEHIGIPKIIAQSSIAEVASNERFIPLFHKHLICKSTGNYENSIYELVKKSLTQEDFHELGRIMSFKCYICLKCWEYYRDFKEHLKWHMKSFNKKLFFSFEVIMNCFVNIVALPDVNNCEVVMDDQLPIIDANGDEVLKCLKCKEMFKDRADLNKHKNELSTCSGCGIKDLCFNIKSHEGTCSSYYDPLNLKMPSAMVKIEMAHNESLVKHPAYCEVCMSHYPSEELLLRHQLSYHQVRSDEFTLVTTHKCQLCSTLFVSAIYHHCPEMKDQRHCKWCKRQFRNIYFLEAHLKAYKKRDFSCRKCKMILRRECLREEHNATHHASDRVVVYKCNICQQTFKTDEDVVEHMPYAHADQLRNYVYRYRKEIVPVGSVFKNDSTIEATYKSNVKNEICVSQSTLKKLQNCINTNETITANERNDSQEVNVKVDPNIQAINKVNLDYEISNKQLQNCINTNETITFNETNDTREITLKEDPKIQAINKANVDFEISNTQSVLEKLQNCIDTSGSITFNENDYTEEEVTVIEERIEYLDITENAPDIQDDMSEPDEFRLVIKEEPIDDDYVFEATTAEELIKQEIKSEPEECDEMIVLQEYPDQEPEETIDQFIKNHSEITMMEIEPELLIKDHDYLSKAKKKQSKIYNCNKCEFTGSYGAYKQHRKESHKRDPGKVFLYTCKRCNFTGNHSAFQKHRQKLHKQDPNKIKKKPFKNKMNDLLESSTIVCKECHKKFNDIKIYLMHLKYHGIPSKVCPECYKGLEMPTKLKTHVLQHIKSNFVRMFIINEEKQDSGALKVFHCIKCDSKDIFESESIVQHWESHLILNETKVYNKKTKKHSDTSSITEESPDFEITPTHLNDENFVGNLAPESKKYLLDGIQEDISTRKGKLDNKVCQVCNHPFSRFNDLKRHFIEHIYEEARANKPANEGLKCPICMQIHRSKDNFKQHMRDHAGLPLYQCHICNKTFSDSSNFAKHKKVHGMKVMICDMCHRKFQCKIQLQNHITKHMKAPPHQCQYCPSSFFYKSAFTKHVKRLHSGETQLYCCSICRSRFKSLREKWIHEWEVHRVRKSKADCPICSEQFRKFSDLKVHLHSEHNVHLCKSKHKFSKFVDAISKYNVPREVIEELLQNKTEDNDLSS